MRTRSARLWAKVDRRGPDECWLWTGSTKSRPTKAQLQDSALAWLAMAQTQMGSVQYWSEQGDRTHETLASLKVLASHIAHAQRALRESELAK